jgi:putative transposase
MKDLLLLIVHLLTTIAKLLAPGGIRAVVAESLLLKHQLLIVNRPQRRRASLCGWDRLLLGVTTLVVNPNRIRKLAVILKPATFKFHQALIKQKYRLLFSSPHRRRPGPKGPSKELIAAIVEMKRRNPRFGCPRIAQEIAHTFGVDINKDVVRPVPGPGSGAHRGSPSSDTSRTVFGAWTCFAVNPFCSRAIGFWF